MELTDATVRVEDERRLRVSFLDVSDDALVVRVGKLEELLRREVVRPGIEDLHYLRTTIDLVAHVHAERVRQLGQERVKRLWILRHDLLRRHQVSVAGTLHGVRRERPRRSNETEHGGLSIDLLSKRAENLPNERQLRVRIIELWNGSEFITTL